MSGETEASVSGWTTDTLHSLLVTELTTMQKLHTTQLEDLRAMMQERYETQTKAVDAAFLAQRTAMETALIAADKAVQTALSAAEKAVTKAELAADKRFESVNEFRAQLADQASTFMPRTEAGTRFDALAEKVSTETSRNAQAITELDRRLSSRMDISQGQLLGVSTAKMEQHQNTGQVYALIGLIVTIVIAATAIIVAFHK